jgi:hypothetical protein
VVQRRLQSRFGMRMLDAKTAFIMATKPVSHIAQSARLPDRLREVLRHKHYSLRTKEACLYWVPFFVRWHARSGQVRRIVGEN